MHDNRLNPVMIMFVASLFYALVPGTLITLPSSTSDKMQINAVHALVFALILHFTYKKVWKSFGATKKELADHKKRHNEKTDTSVKVAVGAKK